VGEEGRERGSYRCWARRSGAGSCCASHRLPRGGLP
jgi:hypothetical protein